MKFSVMTLALIVFVTGCARKDDSSGKSSSTRKTEQITREVKQKELEVIQEKSRDDKYAILMDARMGLGSKITASRDIVSIMNEMIDGQGAHSDEQKEMLTDEFVLRMGDIYSQVNFKKLNPLKIREHYESSFYAMAASLDGSFYEIIKAALRKDSKGSTVKSFESNLVIHDSKQMAINLLEARVDVLSVFALQNLTDKEKMSFWQKTKSFAFSLTGGIIGSIEYPETYAKANDATKHQIEDHLIKAVETKNFLKGIGIDKKLNKKMRSAYKEIDFGEKKDSIDNKDIQIDQRKELIKKKIQHLLN